MREAARWIIGFLFLCPLLAQAEQKNGLDAENWLAKMAYASKHLSYKGIFIHERQNGLLRSLQVYHRWDGQSTSERLIFLDGPPGEVIRHGDKVVTIGMRNGGSYHSRSLGNLGSDIALNPAEITQAYQARLVGKGRVAARTAVVMDLVPKDSNRYGWRLWLDQDSGLLLKGLLVTNSAAVLERFQFVSLKMGPLSADLFKLPAHEQEKLKALDDSGTDNLWQAGWVPKGFKLTERQKVPDPMNKRLVDSLMYSDGLVSFSVFVEPDQEQVQSEVEQRQGATSALSRVMHVDNQSFTVTVVGEIPMGTAERIAVSVQPANAGGK